MNTSSRASRFRLPAVGLALALTSCALPPREAWRVIQTDGLFPYIAVEMGKRPIPNYVRRTNAPATVAKSGGKKVANVQPTISVPWRKPDGAAILPQTRYLADATKPVAPKPAVAPPPAPASPPLEFRTAVPAQRSVAETPKPKSKPNPSLSIPEPKTEKPKAAASTPSKVVEAPKPKADVPPAPKPAPEKKVAAEDTKPKTVPAPAAGAVQPAVDIPYGTSVPGRPGLVTSPYAGALQLVDVTGLAPGQEVKCPYSGKLFRVPGAQEALNKAGADEKKKP